MNKPITIKKTIRVCDHCGEELLSWGNVTPEPEKDLEYHVACYEELSERR